MLSSGQEMDVSVPCSGANEVQKRLGVFDDEGCLPLTPFERYLVRDSALAASLVIRVAMNFRGECHRELLTKAYRIAASRQPMFHATLTKASDVKWQVSECCLDLIWKEQIASAEGLADAVVTEIDLNKEPGLRTTVTPHDQGLFVTLDVQHACCDGQGARQLLAEWWGIYDQLVRQGDYQLKELQIEPLLERGVYRRPERSSVGFWEGLWNLFLTVRGRTVRLAAQGVAHTHRRPLERVLSVSQTASLREALKEQGFSINDLGVAASFVAYEDVFQKRGRGTRLTVVNPVDLRYPSDLKVAACNRVGLAYLRRAWKRSRDLKVVLKEVRGILEYVKRKYVGAEFLHGLAGLENNPKLYDWVIRNKFFTPTLQFTCLGDTTRAMRYRFQQTDGAVQVGMLFLDRISGIAPLAPGVPLSISACETSDRLSLTFHADGGFISVEEQSQFATRFMNLLMSVCD